MISRSVTILLLVGLCLGLPVGLQAGLDPLVCTRKPDFDPPPSAPPVAPLDAGFVGTIYEGATPPGLDPTLPVLVLVQGLHGEAADWWENTEYYGPNDMYDAAYAAGYKTFYVDLWDAVGEAETSIANGMLLRDQLHWITDYWGVDLVNIIAHSKGGLDTNAAAVMGAPIDTIMTLSSPHWGSPLADLAQTDWLEWLAELLGSNDAGTKFIQTGCMALFRNAADARPQNQDLSFYTAAGTGWGPLFSALQFGGLYLAVACPGGDNDGLVCVEQARHPLARDSTGVQTGEHRQVWDIRGPDFELDHDNIRMGNAFLDFFWWWEPDDCYIPVFDEAETYVGGFHGAMASGAAGPQPGTADPGSVDRGSFERPLMNLFRGGPIGEDDAVATFPVEDGVRRLEIRVLLSGSAVVASLHGPDGSIHRFTEARPNANEILADAWSSAARLRNPAAGQWEVRFSAPDAAAYALEVAFDGGVRLDLETPGSRLAQTAGSVPIRIGGEAAGLTIDVAARRISTGGPARSLGRQRLTGTGRHSIRLEGGPGVHNLALTLTGKTATGVPFERSAVLSVGVPDPDAAGGLPPACR